jgi:hypothetical protein
LLLPQIVIFVVVVVVVVVLVVVSISLFGIIYRMRTGKETNNYFVPGKFNRLFPQAGSGVYQSYYSLPKNGWERLFCRQKIVRSLNVINFLHPVTE